MVRLSIMAFPKNESLIQREFCSNEKFSTKRDQKRFFKDSL